jgi:hypothetical protein
MMELLGAAPVAMGQAEVYTSIQQGILDGAENNEFALTVARHAEVAKHYSMDTHTRIPDIVLISASALAQLSDSERQAVFEAARESTEFEKQAWKTANFAKLFSGKIPGSLTHTNIVGNMMFGAVSGSATAGFAYGILKAVRKRYIDKSYAALAEKAVRGVVSHINPDGELTQVSFGTAMGEDHCMDTVGVDVNMIRRYVKSLISWC